MVRQQVVPWLALLIRMILVILVTDDHPRDTAENQSRVHRSTLDFLRRRTPGLVDGIPMILGATPVLIPVLIPVLTLASTPVAILEAIHEVILVVTLVVPIAATLGTTPRLTITMTPIETHRHPDGIGRADGLHQGLRRHRTTMLPVGVLRQHPAGVPVPLGELPLVAVQCQRLQRPV